MLVWWLALFKESLLIFRLIGPPSDYAISSLFQKSKKDSIYGRLYQSNMDGPRSFFKDREALDQLVESEKVAFVQHGDPINFFEDYHCKVLNWNHLNLLFIFQFILLGILFRYILFGKVMCLFILFLCIWKNSLHLRHSSHME